MNQSASRWDRPNQMVQLPNLVRSASGSDGFGSPARLQKAGMLIASGIPATASKTLDTFVDEWQSLYPHDYRYLARWEKQPPSVPPSAACQFGLHDRTILADSRSPYVGRWTVSEPAKKQPAAVAKVSLLQKDSALRNATVVYNWTNPHPMPGQRSQARYVVAGKNELIHAFCTIATVRLTSGKPNAKPDSTGYDLACDQNTNPWRPEIFSRWPLRLPFRSSLRLM